jgi:hypothetical protein
MKLKMLDDDHHANVVPRPRWLSAQRLPIPAGLLLSTILGRVVTGLAMPGLIGVLTAVIVPALSLF